MLYAIYGCVGVDDTLTSHVGQRLPRQGADALLVMCQLEELVCCKVTLDTLVLRTLPCVL